MLGVYSLFAIGMTNEIISVYSDLVRLGADMAEFGRINGDAFTWHGMVISSEGGPRWSIPIVAASMCLLAFLGSVLFFFV